MSKRVRPPSQGERMTGLTESYIAKIERERALQDTLKELRYTQDILHSSGLLSYSMSRGDPPRTQAAQGALKRLARRFTKPGDEDANTDLHNLLHTLAENHRRKRRRAAETEAHLNAENARLREQVEALEQRAVVAESRAAALQTWGELQAGEELSE